MKIVIGNGGTDMGGTHEDISEGHTSTTQTIDAPSQVQDTTEDKVQVPEVNKPSLVPVALSSGVMAIGRTTEIACCDCGGKRTIKVQDVFQVRRCVDCQKKYRSTQRSAKRKEKRQTDKAADTQSK